MLQWFRKRTETSHRAEKLYGSVVTAARQPFFYKDMGVLDTPEGRFELIALHLFLVLEPLRQRGSDETALAQRTIEAFVTDMDDCMREMGVGDLAVPKKVKRAAAAFYERASVYRNGLAAGQGPDLEASLKCYVFAGRTGLQPEADARALAQYVRATAEALSEDGIETVLKGAPEWFLAAWARNEKVERS